MINNAPLVKDETRKRVLEEIDRLGYTPSLAARMMRSQESNMIGFLANQITTTSSSTALIDGAQEAAWRHGKLLMLFNIGDADDRERQAIEQLVSFRAAAMIYATQHHRQVALTALSAMPTILLNCFDASDRHTSFVPDDDRAAYDITTEALRHGSQHPLFLTVARE